MNKDEILDMIETYLTVFTPEGPEGHLEGKEVFTRALLAKVKVERKELLEKFAEYLETIGEAWWISGQIDNFLKEIEPKEGI